ncbi:unnamed protein product, partial [Fasciola hepatica]
QQNRVQINFTTIKSSDLAEDEGRDANTINLEIELRATHCMEVETKKTITIQFESRFDEQLISKNATVDVRHKGQPITDLDLKMYINTSDVYPGDTMEEHFLISESVPSMHTTTTRIFVDIHQFDPCIKPYTLAPEGGPTLPQSLLLFNRSYIRVKDILIICHPVPQLATFSYPRMKCTGLVDGNRLTWFDLGPMISQIITYQNEDKRFFANLSGKMCAEFTVDDWNLCFDGIYYKNQMVAVWTDEAGLQLPSSG